MTPLPWKQRTKPSDKFLTQEQLWYAAIALAARAVVDIKTGGIGGNIEWRKAETTDPPSSGITGGRYSGCWIRDHTAVGLAGALAETIQQEGPDEVDLPEFVIMFLHFVNNGTVQFSPAEAEMIGDYNSRDIERTVCILLDNWALVLRRARWEKELAQGSSDVETWPF